LLFEEFRSCAIKQQLLRLGRQGECDSIVPAGVSAQALAWASKPEKSGFNFMKAVT
jgi:hypothetical protein